MKSIIYPTIFTCLFSVAVGGVGIAENTHFIVQDKRAQSVIVQSKNPSKSELLAVEELQYHIERAVGIRLEVKTKKEVASIPQDWVRISFESDQELPLEAFKVKADGNSLVFTGHSKNTLGWAVDYYLDTQLGVRWLWPGDVGTYVPEKSSIPLTDIDITRQPPLEIRSLRTDFKRWRDKNPVKLLTDIQYKQQTKDANDWARRFQIGSRSEYEFGHSFTKWWEKYGEKHPDYFAVPAKGSKDKQPWPRSRNVKLNLSNEKVDDQIIQEWKDASMPYNWNISPNDNAGYDASDATRAMDDPPFQDADKIWSPKHRYDINLTARYVKFWNRLITKMRKERPDVHLSTYAYSSYRFAPKNGLKLEPNIVIGVVPRFDEAAKEEWQGWYDAGAEKLVLRPNWWHIGGSAPTLPLHRQGEFIKFVQQRGMIGFDSDSLMGFWGTQGPLYYTVARLTQRPDLSVDEVIDEYASGFGDAASTIKEYLNYWEKFTNEVGLDYGAPDAGSIAEKLIKEHDLSPSYHVHGWQLIPYLYTDEKLNEAFSILDKADLESKNDNEYVKKRIQFLREGLNNLKLTRDVLKLEYTKDKTPEQQAEFVKLSIALQDMRKELAPQYVVWGDAANNHEMAWLAAPQHVRIVGDVEATREYRAKNYSESRGEMLNTGWRFNPMPQDDGIEKGVLKMDFNDNDWTPISPLNFWQRQGFGKYHGVGWYRMKFQGESLNKDEIAEIYFGAIDGNATVYLNGHKVAEHKMGPPPKYEGWDVPFVADISNIMKKGENVLAIKVVSKNNNTPTGLHKGVEVIIGKKK